MGNGVSQVLPTGAGGVTLSHQAAEAEAGGGEKKSGARPQSKSRRTASEHARLAFSSVFARLGPRRDEVLCVLGVCL